MLKEYHYDHLIRWPNGERACVFLTFDFQGGEDVKPDKNGILNYENWSQGEYGPHHAIYRLLRVLKEENVKATFLTCGAIAERFPEAVQAILDHGHVVEGHGYNHEIARYLPRDEEDKVMKKAIAMIQQRTGRRPMGWRSCTQSTNTIELLIENGFTFNTNSFHDELPYLWEKDGKVMVELPRQPFGDGTLFGHRHGEYGNPYHGLETWKAYFDELYSESSRRPRNTFRSRCIPTSSDGLAARWRCAASSSTCGRRRAEISGSRPASISPSSASTTCSRPSARSCRASAG